MWKPPLFGALSLFCLSVVFVVIQWQKTAADIHKASQNNDMVGMAYWAILPMIAITIFLATIAGAALGWIYAALRQENASRKARRTRS